MATALLQACRVISGHTSTAAISTEGFDDGAPRSVAMECVENVRHEAW